MRTLIADGHVRDVVGHEITPIEAATVVKVLAAFGIHIMPTEPDFFGVVHLWAREPIDTRGEARALAAFRAVTDSPLAWHPAAVVRTETLENA